MASSDNLPEALSNLDAAKKRLDEAHARLRGGSASAPAPVAMTPRDEALRRIRAQYPQYAGIADDDLAAKITAKYPQYAQTLTKPAPALSTGQQMAGKLQAGRPPGPLGLPSIPAPPVGLAVPPLAGVLGRTLAQGAAGAAESLLGGQRRPGEVAKEAGKSALFNVGAEGLLKGFGAIAKQGAAKTSETGFERAKQEHTERAVATIADDLKRANPALNEFPSDTKGLVDMIYGKGRAKVHEAFDASMREIQANAKGKMVQIPAETAERLKIEAPASPLAGMAPHVVEALRKAGRLPQGAGAGTPGTVSVDAADLAGKATGFWKKDPGTYRRAMDALDTAGLGDPGARTAYKSYAGLSAYIDKTKALKGERFDPEAFLSGATDLKKIGELQRRGLGSATEGPLATVRGGPQAPDITRTGPGVTRGIGAAAGHALGYPLGGLFGHPYWGALAGGALGGGLATKAFPRGLVTNVAPQLGPLTARGAQVGPGAMRTLPGPLGIAGREYTMPIQTSTE